MYLIGVLSSSFIDKVIVIIKTYSVVFKLSTTEFFKISVITNPVKRGGVKIIFCS
jgi:acetyl-CoA carboxylase beta subunit